jgi:DNA-binding beta-propeller fold protein YncE
MNGMKRLAVVLVAAALLVPGAAHAAACAPLNCAASQFSLAGGTMMGFRTAANAPITVVDLRTGKARWTIHGGFESGDLIVHMGSGAAIVWTNAATNKSVQRVSNPQLFQLVGVSQNGSRAVLKDGSRFAVVSPGKRQVVRVPLGRWDFDALAGDNLFLIKYDTDGGYQVRLVHLSTGKIDPNVLKERIWGTPFSRVASPDGHYLFTMYIAPNGAAMVHQLDLRTASARCIDLPGTGDYGSAATWAMVLSGDAKTLWAVSPGYGRVIGIDVGSRTVTTSFRIDLPSWNIGNPTGAVLSPDGKSIAIADKETVAVVDLAAQKVVQRDKGKAIALGYSPDGKNLWKFV